MAAAEIGRCDTSIAAKVKSERLSAENFMFDLCKDDYEKLTRWASRQFANKLRELSPNPNYTPEDLVNSAAEELQKDIKRQTSAGRVPWHVQHGVPYRNLLYKFVVRKYVNLHKQAKKQREESEPRYRTKEDFAYWKVPPDRPDKILELREQALRDRNAILSSVADDPVLLAVVKCSLNDPDQYLGEKRLEIEKIRRILKEEHSIELTEKQRYRIRERLQKRLAHLKQSGSP